MRVLFLAAAIALLFFTPPAQASLPGGGGVTIRLVWTSPGGDGWAGQASGYDLRYSPYPITEASFPQATKVWWMPPPGLPGSFQSVTVPHLPSQPRYYFALKTRDARGNWSRISNLALYQGSALDVEIEGGAPMISDARPNPARSETRFALTLPEPTSVHIEVFDAGGRRVRTLLSGLQPAGNPELVWDLRDNTGRAVRPGVFFVRGRIGGTQFVKRVSLI